MAEVIPFRPASPRRTDAKVACDAGKVIRLPAGPGAPKAGGYRLADIADELRAQWWSPGYKRPDGAA